MCLGRWLRAVVGCARPLQADGKALGAREGVMADPDSAAVRRADTHT